MRKTPRKQRPAALPPIPTEEARLRTAFETYRLLDEIGPEGWPGSGDLRDIAERLDVPYLMLLLDHYERMSDGHLTLVDIAEWNASAVAQRVLSAAWVQEEAVA